MNALLAFAVAFAQDPGAEVVVPAAKARIRTVGGTTEGGWSVWSNGSLGDWFDVGKATKVVVTVRVAGRRAKGVWPRAELRVGTWTQEFDVDSDDWRDRRFEVDAAAGPLPVAVTFLNDFFEGGEDRNLLVAELRVAGATLRPEIPTTKELTDADIAAHRRGTLTILTTPGTAVKVTQTRHDFAFGTALATHVFAGGVKPEARDAYLKIARENFNAAVFENALKWHECERKRGAPSWEPVDAIEAFCRENKFRLRGHCLFWAADDMVPPWAKALDDDDLRKAISTRISDVGSRYKGRIHEYDVNNEMIQNHFFEKRLGAEIHATMFRLARDADPAARLYVNEYDVLNGASLAAYESLIRGLLERKAPVGGIGCQSHFGRPPPHFTLRASLDRLAKFNLPITITEVSLDNADEDQKAEDLEALLRACFAHPAVDGFFLWGFWEGAHWKPKAALWRRDFTETPAAKAYRRLVFGEWWTAWDGKADAAGRCDVPAFYGRHRVEAGGASADVDFPRADGKTKTVRVGS